ncbi:hypothetical protein GFS31_06580 [Leptolyngbya sp. BL0902]|nr:hypothetical protein GFS31_06580 [Leptolyngbya sp. BL0902]
MAVLELGDGFNGEEWWTQTPLVLASSALWEMRARFLA